MEILGNIIHYLGTDSAAFIGATLAGALGYYANHFYNKFKKYREEKKSQEIPHLMEKDLLVYQYLTELLVEAKADRAYVAQFHNGIYYINKSNQMRISCSHEVVRPGISRVQDSLQNELMTKFADQISKLLEHGSYVFIINDEESSYFADLKREQGAKVVISSLIRNGEIIEGSVSVSYLNDNEISCTNHADFMKEKEMVEKTAGRIGHVLRKAHE